MSVMFDPVSMEAVARHRRQDAHHTAEQKRLAKAARINRNRESSKRSVFIRNFLTLIVMGR
jgi:hypothetical protein